MSGIPKTLGFCFIAKTQEQADEMLEKWSKYFDQVYYEVGTITDSFSDARNKVLDKVKTDYWCWWDTDDDVAGIENLRPLVEQMEIRSIDATYLPYEYAYNTQGECIVLQWRERIIRTAHNFRWLGAIHESLISQNQSPVLDRSELVTIQHTKDESSHAESAERNHIILLREYNKKPRDPRTTHYLAMSTFNKNEYKRAIELFQEHIKTSGWDEDRYRSWFYIGQAYGLLDDNKSVLAAAMAGVALIPSRPEAYCLAATAEFEMKHYMNALDWLMNASTKEPPKNSLSAIDPTYYSYKAEFLAALCYLHLGRSTEAYQQLQQVLIHSPNFEQARMMVPLFQELRDDDRAADYIKWLVEYVVRYNGKPEKIFEALPGRLSSDPRLTATRIQVIKPKKWPKKSLVFFCGQTAEAWGPDTLSKGMGGSEEAIVYLSRELTKLGWQVTVFCDRDEEYEDYQDEVNTQPVCYVPWTAFNPSDEFDVLVVWRHAAFFANHDVKARVKALDLHDAPVGHQDIPEEAVAKTDLFLFKSHFQRDIGSHIPDNKVAIIPNGIVPEQFKHKVKRYSKKVVWGSSYDRGLGCLLQIWPEVKKAVPQAELDIYYGWNTFDAMFKDNPERMKWKWQLIREMHQAGATEHGRVDHETLAKAYLGAAIWAYPTEFPEISCITAMKAGAAGLTSVTTGFAALSETVLDDRGPVSADNESMYSNDYRKKSFTKLLIQALKTPDSDEERRERQKRYLDAYAWKNVAKQWSEALGEDRKR